MRNLSEQFWLRRHPSTKRWELELRRILSGERESDLQRIGGVTQYVKRYIFDAEDPAKSETAFGNALHDVVQAWNPDRSGANGFYYTNLLLELIVAFKPKNAFGPVLDRLLKRSGKFAPGKWKAEEVDRVNNLALSVLQQQYKVAPPSSEQEPAFQKYKTFLDSLLQVPGKEGYALRRLFELGLEDPASELVAELVSKPGVVPQVVQYAFSTKRHDLMKKCAGIVLGRCLRLDSKEDAGEETHKHYEEFRACLAMCGAELIHGDDAPYVKLSDGRQIQLWLLPRDEHYYVEAREEESRKAGRAKWAMIDDETA